METHRQRDEEKYGWKEREKKRRRIGDTERQRNIEVGETKRQRDKKRPIVTDGYVIILTDIDTEKWRDRETDRLRD
jgi:hypothetical protein